MSAEHQRFVETFVRSRGIIRDVERALGVSYPTVRARLDAAVSALEAVMGETTHAAGASAGSSASEAIDREEAETQRHALLKRVEAGELSAAEAADLLRKG